MLNFRKIAEDISEFDISADEYNEEGWDKLIQLWAEYSGGRAFPEVMPTNSQDLAWFAQFPELVKVTIESASEQEHSEVWIELGNQGAAIDEEMAPLMMYLWKNGISTISSCQGDPGGESAVIMFATDQDLNAFLSLVPLPTTAVIGGTIVNFPQEVLNTFRANSIGHKLNLKKKLGKYCP